MTVLQTHRRGLIDPTLLAAIRARRAALAGAPPAPAPVAPVVAPPPAPTPAPPRPPDPFSPAAAEALYTARRQVTRQAGVDRVRALAGPEDAPRPPAATAGPAPGWPDPAEVYARRAEDVRRAQHRG
jgi:hypothetical protein